MRNRPLHALFGVLATLLGVAVGHLVASLLIPSSSPVLAVGSTVIDHTPHQLKDWAIRSFGNSDKAILVDSVLGGVLVLAAIAGLLALRRFAYGAALLVILVAVAAGAAVTRPTAGFQDLVPSIATGIAGVAALWWLTRAAGSRPEPDPASEPGATTVGPTRRGVLVAVGALGVAATVMGGAGRSISKYRTRPEDVTLPAAADPAPPFPVGLDDKVPGISPFRSSNEDFYRVDTRLDVPIVSIEGWTLTIDGDVERELTFTFDELAAMPLIERDITLTCVSNSVGGKYVGGARWLGVRLTDLLDLAGVGDQADQMFATDVDGMTIGTPLELATDGRDAMIAIGMNGEALPRAHGFPARVVIPGLYGFISATKWVTRITLTTYEKDRSYWTQRRWATDAPIKLSSRIDTPRAFETVKAGQVLIGGMAWAQDLGGVARVEVRIDGGAWQEARLGPDAGNDYWRQWYLPWYAQPGDHALAVRAVNGGGEVQSAVRALPFPEGSSGIQDLQVTVA
ncbi:MAG: oxidoreductase, molybdopterin binding protein [Nocardioides sp.]|nr:oxidoreductase, molybdopterin binding protein [Nocardioides sp.]